MVYDEYVGWLLDTHPTQSHILRDQVNDLYSKGVSNPEQLTKVQQETGKLEKDGKRLLETNDKLREDVRKAKDMAARKTSPGQELNHLFVLLYGSVKASVSKLL